MAYRKMYMVPAEDPDVVNWFKSKLTEDPTLDTAAKLSAKKLRILRDPKMSSAEKQSLVQQINPKIHSLIKRMRQLPTGISTDEIPDEDDEDLITTAEQKLLQRILKNISPGRRRIKEEPITPITEPITPTKTGRKPRISRKKAAEELPFAQSELPRDIEGTVSKILRKTRKEIKEKQPLAVRRLKRAKNWEDWEPQGAKLRRGLFPKTP